MKIRESGSKQGGRSHSLLSKTTVNYVLAAVVSLIRKDIVRRVKEAGVYSIQIDTTQDISVEDQCSIVLRYVHEQVEESLIAVSNFIYTKGEAFAIYVFKV